MCGARGGWGSVALAEGWLGGCGLHPKGALNTQFGLNPAIPKELGAKLAASPRRICVVRY